MSAANPAQMPNPMLIFETLNAYQRSAALKAAIELDVFTAIGEGATTAAALAQRCSASPRGMRILCDFVVTLHLLTKEDNCYGLTPDAAMFLDRKSAMCMASAANFLGSATLAENFKNLAQAVRKGRTVMGPEGTLAPEHPLWVEFARSMAPLMAMPAEMIAQVLQARSAPKWKVLDIAAGHGMFGITLARHNPNTVVVATDWPNVLEVARENARLAGVDSRYETLPGSAFEVEFGSGYDLVLITNFLHHFDLPTCERLLRKVRAALAPDGRALTMDFVPNADRVSPPIPAQFSLMMLSSTPSGDAYTFAEFEQMFRNAGFASSELHALPPSPANLIISRR
jgi:2-polyprenyl-3-methyl-5-hydroxy-6-metoxy-1,4-benzoquinol methylase